MNRRAYLAEALRLYCEAPDTPLRPNRNDWAIAADLYRRAIPIQHLAHAIRLATLRRRQNSEPQQPIASLAYYRAVLRSLSEDALDPAYIDYVFTRFHDS